MAGQWVDWLVDVLAECLVWSSVEMKAGGMEEQTAVRLVYQKVASMVAAMEVQMVALTVESWEYQTVE